MEPRQRLQAAITEAYEVGEVRERELVVPRVFTYVIAPGMVAQYDFELAELASLTATHLEVLAWEAIPVWLSHARCTSHPYIPRQSTPDLISIHEKQDAIHAWRVCWPAGCDSLLLTRSGRMVLGHPADMPDFCICGNDSVGVLKGLERRLTEDGALCVGMPDQEGQIAWVDVTNALIQLVAAAYLEHLR